MLKFKKFMDESVELVESHYKVGDKVKCVKSGKTGVVVKVDEPQTGEYYTVKRDDDGSMMKFAPSGLEKLDESLRKDIAQLAGKFPKGTKVRVKNARKYDSLAKTDTVSGEVLGNGKDFLMVAVGKGQMNVDIKDIVKEEIELDEISKKTLGSYVKKAGASMASHGVAVGSGRNTEKSSRAMANRMKGMNRAADRLTKEEVEQIDELDSKTYRSYHDKATADQIKRMSKDKRSKEDQRIMRKRSLGIATAGMKQYGDKRTMSQRIRGEEVSEAAKNTKHPAHDALMKLAKSRDAGSDAKDYMVAAGKLDNFTATGNRGVLSDLVKLLKNMDSYPRDAVLWTIKKYDDAMFRSLSAKM